MKFKLPFDIPASDLQLDAHSKIGFLGSCFADNISAKMQGLQLQVLSNTFGTIFHPSPLAKQLSAALNNYEEVDVLKREDVYLDWLSSSKIAGSSEEELIEKVIKQREATRSFLLEAKLLVVSFGTAWGYSHNEQSQIVGNCHKQPNTLFTKQLTDIDVMREYWTEVLKDLKKLNPSLRVVFTVSPVRHVKDGLIDNNRSKARLIELVHALCAETNVHYFPAYEILIDELRDHRFFSEDLVHPNTTAIDYIFGRFIDWSYAEEGKKQLSEIQSYINLRDHRVIHSFSQEEEKRQSKLKVMQAEVQLKYPWMT